MSTIDKTVKKMSQNPLGWQIEDLQTVAKHYAIDWRHGGGSHCVFITSSGKTLPVPAKKPIKPVYIKKFLLLLEEKV